MEAGNVRNKHMQTRLCTCELLSPVCCVGGRQRAGLCEPRYPKVRTLTENFAPIEKLALYQSLASVTSWLVHSPKIVRVSLAPMSAPPATVLHSSPAQKRQITLRVDVERWCTVVPSFASKALVSGSVACEFSTNLTTTNVAAVCMLWVFTVLKC